MKQSDKAVDMTKMVEDIRADLQKVEKALLFETADRDSLRAYLAQVETVVAETQQAIERYRAAYPSVKDEAGRLTGYIQTTKEELAKKLNKKQQGHVETVRQKADDDIEKREDDLRKKEAELVKLTKKESQAAAEAQKRDNERQELLLSPGRMLNAIARARALQASLEAETARNPALAWFLADELKAELENLKAVSPAKFQKAASDSLKKWKGAQAKLRKATLTSQSAAALRDQSRADLEQQSGSKTAHVEEALAKPGKAGGPKPVAVAPAARAPATSGGAVSVKTKPGRPAPKKQKVY
jgi:hypothetical protein